MMKQFFFETLGDPELLAFKAIDVTPTAKHITDVCFDTLRKKAPEDKCTFCKDSSGAACSDEDCYSIGHDGIPYTLRHSETNGITDRRIEWYAFVADRARQAAEEADREKEAEVRGCPRAPSSWPLLPDIPDNTAPCPITGADRPRGSGSQGGRSR